jgi:LytS/YehU family sensor histidine kinase
MLGVATILIAITQSVIDQVIYHEIILAYGERSAGRFDPIGISFNLSGYVWLYGLYVVALELLRMVVVASDEARRAAEARVLAHEARLQALRFQLNPHFLFNTLNAISGLMLAGSVKQAEQMLAKLSDFLRATLGKDEGALVPLVAELGIIEAYLDIESVRFGPALSVRIDCPESLFFAKVPVFILQPLVENAVKYAIAPSENGGRVTIRVRSEEGRLRIAVIDRGADVPVFVDSTGVGLDNTRARLAALYNGDASLHADAHEHGFTARLDLPLQIDGHEGVAG